MDKIKLYIKEVFTGWKLVPLMTFFNISSIIACFTASRRGGLSLSDEPYLILVFISVVFIIYSHFVRFNKDYSFVGPKSIKLRRFFAYCIAISWLLSFLTNLAAIIAVNGIGMQN